ncbi:MAG: histidinol-phosphatase HisJ family protein [Oscillospiraceae bacterium]|nr:histidinol-phosphatase HisJ family protein [Oscillospiraceae bacterium]
MNLMDCHTHTQFSVDSEADINEMLEKACATGLAAYAVTDHAECNRWYSAEHYADDPTYPYYNFGDDFENSVSSVTKLKEKYEGRLNLICGTEMGQATHNFEIAEKIISDSRLDFVIGSMHQLPRTEDFAFLDYGAMSEDEIYALAERYFLEIHKLCQWGKFDVLGHLTYNLRYIKGNAGIDLDITRFDEVIAESLRLLAEKGRGIEINTSGYRQKYGDSFPSLKYVKLFRDLGGEIISVGSDAHTVEDLGKNVKDGAETALAAGFRHLCYFKERKPQFIKIDG